jgi:hypothetical protein
MDYQEILVNAVFWQLESYPTSIASALIERRLETLIIALSIAVLNLAIIVCSGCIILRVSFITN